MAMSTAMTFVTSSGTPLYSSLWTPASRGQYAGTCIFLIVLAVVYRGLQAVKIRQEELWIEAEVNRRVINVAGRQAAAAKSRILLSEKGSEEEVVVLRNRHGAMPWRVSTDSVRAVMDTVITGVSYLLMLAVMTMNVGYFFSVLAGTCIGSLFIGRFSTNVQH